MKDFTVKIDQIAINEETGKMEIYYDELPDLVVVLKDRSFIEFKDVVVFGPKTHNDYYIHADSARVGNFIH